MTDIEKIVKLAELCSKFYSEAKEIGGDDLLHIDFGYGISSAGYPRVQLFRTDVHNAMPEGCKNLVERFGTLSTYQFNDVRFVTGYQKKEDN